MRESQTIFPHLRAFASKALRQSWLSAIVLSTALLGSDTTYAQEANKFSMHKPFNDYVYLGGKIGATRFAQACGENATSCQLASVAGGAFVGYQWLRNFGIEFGYDNFGAAVAYYPESGQSNRYKGVAYGFELTGKANFPIADNIDMFFKAGTAYFIAEVRGAGTKTSDQDFVPTIGTGFQYGINDLIDLRTEYQYFDRLGTPEVGGAKVHMFTLGVIFNFGRDRIIKTANTVAPKPQPYTSSVMFAFDSTVIQNPDNLDTIINLLKQDKTAVVVIRGFTDSTGPALYNLKLSLERANTVAQHLRDQGIGDHQIILEGFGANDPVASNATPEGRHKNRHVLVILEHPDKGEDPADVDIPENTKE